MQHLKENAEDRITIYWCFHGCNLFKISSANDPVDSTSLDEKIDLLRRPKTAVSTCQRPLAVCHLLRPVHRLTQTISALGRKNENATIWETSSRETNYIKTYIYDFVTLKGILLPANASFDVFGHLCHIPSTSYCQCSNLSTAQAAQQNQPLWEAGGSSNSMLGFTSSRTPLCPGTCSCTASWK